MNAQGIKKLIEELGIVSAAAYLNDVRTVDDEIHRQAKELWSSIQEVLKEGGSGMLSFQVEVATDVSCTQRIQGAVDEGLKELFSAAGYSIQRVTGCIWQVKVTDEVGVNPKIDGVYWVRTNTDNQEPTPTPTMSDWIEGSGCHWRMHLRTGATLAIISERDKFWQVKGLDGVSLVTSPMPGGVEEAKKIVDAKLIEEGYILP